MSAIIGPNFYEDNLIFHVDIKDSRCYTSGSSTCTDIIGNRNGTFGGGTSGSDDGFIFANSGDWIEWTSDNDLDIAENGSFVGWAKPTAVGSKQTILRFRYGNEEQYALMVNGNEIHWEAWTLDASPRRDVQTDGVDWVAGSWYQWGIVLESSSSVSHSLNFYQNGDLVYTSSNYNYEMRTNSTNPFYIGGGPNGSGTPLAQMFGKIAIASVYDEALTPQKMKKNYIAMRGRFGL